MSWIKITYDRNDYVVNLDCISAFAIATNGKITFWLPDSGLPIIITSQSNPDEYQQVLNFVQNVNIQLLGANWIKVIYDRSEYIIDLSCLSSFCNSPSGKLTFWLRDSRIPVIINKQNDPDCYHKLLDYIKRKTGHSF